MVKKNSHNISKFLLGKKVKAFLKTRFFKNVLLFSFFSFVAFGFWVLQILQQDFEISTTINIQYKNLPDGYVLTNQPAGQIDITVKDKGSALLNYVARNKFAPIELNLPEDGNGSISFNKTQLQSIISKQLITTTQLVKMVPDSIVVHYSKLSKKRVPVRFTGEAIPAPGYIFDKHISADPQFVEVHAPASVLDTLSYIPTESLRFDKITKKTLKDIRLKFPPNVSSKTEGVRLELSVETASEKKLEVPVSIEGIPQNLDIKLFPAKVEVVCRLPVSRHNQISASDFKVEIPYGDIVNNKNGWAIAQITQQPGFVDFARLSSSRIDFILEERK